MAMALRKSFYWQSITCTYFFL